MSKKLSKKSFKQQHDEAMSGLPIHDNQAISDVGAYLLMSDELLNQLSNFDENGDFKFYKVGDVLMGKTTLIQFVKSIKSKI